MKKLACLLLLAAALVACEKDEESIVSVTPSIEDWVIVTGDTITITMSSHENKDR